MKGYCLKHQKTLKLSCPDCNREAVMEWLQKHWVGDEIHTGQTLPAGYYLTFRIRKEEWQELNGRDLEIR